MSSIETRLDGTTLVIGIPNALSALRRADAHRRARRQLL